MKCILTGWSGSFQINKKASKGMHLLAELIRDENKMACMSLFVSVVE